ncbi:MAG: helix-turn-helix transcriptional regulator [Elusimicrobia bacterium]|nr:helix-turn-helix transcriptional regulator [Elusimicrobiota bacterium]
MGYETAAPRLASLLTGLREERGISQRQLADEAGVDSSLVNRVENGRDARLSTWVKLFEGLGYRLLFDTTELCDESADLHAEEAERRRERQREGLCTGKRRYD